MSRPITDRKLGGGAILKWLTGLATAVSLLFTSAQGIQADEGLYHFTGYTCPPFCGNTSDGTPVTLGVAACPPDIPVGTRLSVSFDDQSLIITCHDTYARGLSRRIDVFWPTLQQCSNHTGWYRVSYADA